MIQVIIEGLMLGLTAGGFCLGSCLVFFMPYLLVEGKQRVTENLSKIVLFLLGRLIAYAGFALIVGFAGSSFRNVLTDKFSSFCLVLASLLMLIYALTHNFPNSKFCAASFSKQKFSRLPFFLGLFTGLNPCPPFLAGAGRILTLHSVPKAVILFTAFFAGTSLYLIPLFFVYYLNRRERVKQIGLILSFLSACWFLFIGILGLIG